MVTLLANFLLVCLLFRKDLLIIIRDTRVKIGGRPDRGLVAMESPDLCWLHHLRIDLSPTFSRLAVSFCLMPPSSMPIALEGAQSHDHRHSFRESNVCQSNEVITNVVLCIKTNKPQLFAVQYSELETTSNWTISYYGYDYVIIFT